MKALELLQLSPVIPVITLDRADDARPLAEALLKGGLKVLEITLRTDAALEAISLIHQAFPEAVVGAGTVLEKDAYARAVESGAQFIVSPGCTQALLDAAASHFVPLLPGASTASEVMTLLELGVTEMKFFPAEPAGGIPMLQALAAPLPQAVFCPTGGITPEKAAHYLALPNVACVGGSWMVRKDWIADKRWQQISESAREAADLAR